jgi:archaemetzincin
MRVYLLTSLAFLLFWSCTTRASKVVAIQPYENISLSLIDTLKLTIEKTYRVKTVVFKPKTLPKESFINIKSPRYRADILIEILKREKPDSVDYILGVTTQDISFTKRQKNGAVKEPASKYSDWGIFGLGFRPGPSSIVSTYRLRADNQTLSTARVKKVTIHEVGHNLGLKHCEVESCVMADAAESIKTIDRVNPTLCPRCNKRSVEKPE